MLKIVNKRFPEFRWETLGNDWVLIKDEERLAIVSFIGGHVERPDSWYCLIKGKQHPIPVASLKMAIEEAEDYYGIGSVDKTPGKGIQQ